MPPVKPQRMALEVIISICCAFSGYLPAVQAMVGVMAVVLHPPLHNRLGPALQRVVQAREERVQALVSTQMLQKCAAGRQAELRTGSRR